MSDSTLLLLIIWWPGWNFLCVMLLEKKKIPFVLLSIFQWMNIFLTANYIPLRSSETVSGVTKKEPMRGHNKHAFDPFPSIPKLWALVCKLKHDTGLRWGTRRKQRVQRSSAKSGVRMRRREPTEIWLWGQQLFSQHIFCKSLLHARYLIKMK